MKIRKIIVIIGILIMMMLVLSGCSNKKEKIIENYTTLINEGKYDEFYETLSSNSKEYIKEEFGGKEDFVSKYRTIYSAMGVSNIEIEVKDDSDKLKIPVNISMDTIAGHLKYDDIIINLEKEDNSYKILWKEEMILPGMERGDKVRVKTDLGIRGKIVDRNGNLLAYDGEVNLININPLKFDESNIGELATILDISEEYITKKIENNTKSYHAIDLVKIPNNETEKLEKLTNMEGIFIQKTTSRVYANGEAFGSLLGYIGDITAEELDEKRSEGYTSISKIGKNGLEEVYEKTLRAIDGASITIEKSNKQVLVAEKKAKNGQDIKLAIDSGLQQLIYTQMNKEKGASIAMDSTSGEILAMVSSPSYDSNTLVTYKTKTIAKEWEDMEKAHFDNRVNNLYSPGSTMKLMTAAIGLDNNVINPIEKMKIEGLNWQNSSDWGNYKVTRVKDVNSVSLYEAAVYSDNIYFADKSIKIGSEKLISGAKKFGIGEVIDFEYPMPISQIANDNKINNEILLADTGYGQGEVLVTPLHVTMAYSALANEGKIMTPRLVISEKSKSKVYSEAISSDNIEELKKAFSGVINEPEGSGSLCKINGLNLAGKTGTAEIKATKDDNDGNENGWFVAVDLDNSKLSVSMVMEDMKDKSTSQYLVPKVKVIMESYKK